MPVGTMYIAQVYWEQLKFCGIYVISLLALLSLFFSQGKKKHPVVRVL